MDTAPGDAPLESPPATAAAHEISHHFHLPLLMIRNPNFRAANFTSGPSVNFTITEINSIFLGLWGAWGTTSL